MTFIIKSNQQAVQGFPVNRSYTKGEADAKFAPIRLVGYTVAGLPAGVQGDTAFATDLLAPTFFTAAVGGGAVVGPVFFNGASWICT